MVGKHWSRPWFLVVLLVVLALSACARRRPLEPKSSTWSELREVRPGITVEEPGASARAPFPHERLVDGAEVELAAGALAWLRLDSGATLLLQGPGRFVQRSGGVELNQGRAFLDSPPGPSTELVTPRGTLRLAQVRTSLDVDASGRTEAYVLSGELRAEGDIRVTAGQRAVLAAGAPPKVEPVAVWRDWTGGLATTDQTPAPAPFGVGVVGARLPGEVGAARFPLAIQALRVGATIQGDFAVTEVTETFFNPSSNTVEGVYSLRLPPGATLERFGVDREGRMAWGRVQERQSAAAQYAANVYAGSKEDPALLQWEAPGVYRATLYPIEPGATRRVVLRYTEWLPRSGEHGQRRLYLYPMAAEGAEENLPHLEELTVDLDLRDAHAKEIRSGLSGVREGEHLLIRRQDYVPRADLAVELLDGGEERLVAYRAPHQVDVELLPSSQREAARLAARDERDYLLVPLRGAELPKAKPGVDLSIVVDSSAATSEGALALARAATRALLAHLGANDRVVVWAGADGLRPLLGQPQLATVDAALRDRLSAELARIPRGGATDLGRNLSDALAVLEPERRGAVVYLGDGSPTVGELSQGELLARLDKLPHPAPLFSLGLGEGSDLALLDALSRGGFARRVTDGAGAARAALDVLEAASRGAWMSVAVDLGPGVERVYPRGKGALLVGDSEFVVGRLVADAPPTTMNVTGLGASVQRALTTRTLQDAGDLKRRWAEQRMAELLANREGRASLVDVGMRYGILTPVTSLYVPTKRELAEQYAPMNEAEVATVEQAETADKKEGGTGSRAKGEEGSMGSGASTKAMPFSVRSASQGSAPAAPAPWSKPLRRNPRRLAWRPRSRWPAPWSPARRRPRVGPRRRPGQGPRTLAIPSRRMTWLRSRTASLPRTRLAPRRCSGAWVAAGSG